MFLAQNKDKTCESLLLQTGAVYMVAVQSLFTWEQYCCDAGLKHAGWRMVHIMYTQNMWLEAVLSTQNDGGGRLLQRCWCSWFKASWFTDVPATCSNSQQKVQINTVGQTSKTLQYSCHVHIPAMAHSPSSPRLSGLRLKKEGTQEMFQELLKG